MTDQNAVIGIIDSGGSAGGSTPNLGQVLAVGNDAGGRKEINLADPTNAQDAATKNYVDTGAYGPYSSALTTPGTNVSDGAAGVTFQQRTEPGAILRLRGQITLAANQTFAANSVLLTLPGPLPARPGRILIRTVGSATQSNLAISTAGVVTNLSAITAGAAGDTIAFDNVTLDHA